MWPFTTYSCHLPSKPQYVVVSYHWRYDLRLCVKGQALCVNRQTTPSPFCHTVRELTLAWGDNTKACLFPFETKKHAFLEGGRGENSRVMAKGHTVLPQPLPNFILARSKIHNT